jgi:hypothetical protein
VERDVAANGRDDPHRPDPRPTSPP